MIVIYINKNYKYQFRLASGVMPLKGSYLMAYSSCTFFVNHYNEYRDISNVVYGM